MDRIALFLHVLGAVGLFAALALQVAGAAAVRGSATLERLRERMAWTDWAGPLLRVSAALVIVTGVFLLAAVYRWDAPWAWTGLAAGVVAVALGSATAGPLPPPLARLAGPRGPIALPAAACGLLVGVLFLMTVQPGVATGLAVVLAAAAAGFLAAWLLGGARTPA